MATRRAVLVGSAALALSGCGLGRSRLNPFNWFRSGPAQPVAPPPGSTPANLSDPRPLVDDIAALRVDRTPGGAIVHATGLPPDQGWYDAGLVAENGGKPVKGVLSYTFHAWPPRTSTAISTKTSRELTAAVILSDADLAGVRQIRVSGAKTSRTARR